MYLVELTHGGHRLRDNIIDEEEQSIFGTQVNSAKNTSISNSIAYLHSVTCSTDPTVFLFNTYECGRTTAEMGKNVAKKEWDREDTLA